MFNGLLSKNYKRSTKGESLSKRLWYILLVMLFVIILCFTVALVYLTSRSRSNFEKSQSETRITAVKTGILSEIQNYNSISRLVMIDDTVLKLLRSKSVDVGLKNDARHSVMKILNVCDNVDSVFVLRNDGDFMSTGRGEYFVDLEKMKNEQWKEPIYEMRGKVMFSINGNGALVKNGLSFLTMSRAIYDINSQDLKGILLMNISTEVLAKIVKEQGTQYICITDLDGNYLVGNAELAEYYSADLPKDVITHRMVRHGVTHEMVSTSFIDDLPLVVICSSSVETRNAIPVETILVMLLLLIAFFVLSFLVTAFMDRNLAKPIVELSESIEKAKQSGFLEKLDVEISNDEIGQLADSYNSMIGHLNEMISELIEKEKAQQKAEMSVLYEQIKPHFLYNSLETISYLAVEAGASNVHDALETLGSFYRNFLSKGSRTISFKREITIIKDYLSLQRLRYGDILNDEYEVAEETLDIKIPKLILQPLVENSIYHGIRPKGEEGKIVIKSYSEDGNIHIIVYDNGVGMSDEQIEKLLNAGSPTKKADANDTGSFGLIGTIERIRQYGNRFDSVKITSEIGEYTQIELILPIEEQY
ncbi:MAG: sensor histidine kinase [Lachnospiraceae bacterium]|nr:sensor histidine kinase [Candidatus Colinaster equi]